MKARVAIVSVLVGSLAGVPVAIAQQACPAELTAAKTTLQSMSSAPRTAAGYQGGSGEAPRTAAGYQGGSGEAPRSAAGYQGGSGEAPRAMAGAQAIDPARIDQARALVAESEQACARGDMAGSTQKAKAALESLQ